MSVFIKVKEAEFDQPHNAHQASLNIKSRDTELVVSPIPFVNKITWNCSLIASIKQQKLQFKLTFAHQNQQQNYTLSSWISFSPLHFKPQMESKQIVEFNQNVRLHLDIFLTHKKNFLGPIEFYQYENASSDSIILVQNEGLHGQSTKNQTKTPHSEQTHQSNATSRKEAVKTNGLFFCCGDDYQDKYEVEDEQYPRREFEDKEASFSNELKGNKAEVEFYQGACESKNIFGMCDAGVADKKFAVVEDYYRDLPLT